jgi:hypothetical protein
MKRQDLQPNTAIRGILPGVLVTVVSVRWFGSEALELTYKIADGKVANRLLYSSRLASNRGAQLHPGQHLRDLGRVGALLPQHQAA